MAIFRNQASELTNGCKRPVRRLLKSHVDINIVKYLVNL